MNSYFLQLYLRYGKRKKSHPRCHRVHFLRPHTHTHIYIHVCVCVCVCVLYWVANFRFSCSILWNTISVIFGLIAPLLNNLIGCILRHVNLCRLSNAKISLVLYFKYIGIVNENFVVNSFKVVSWLVGWLVLWHINFCRLFKTKSIFIQIMSTKLNNSV